MKTWKRDRSTPSLFHIVSQITKSSTVRICENSIPACRKSAPHLLYLHHPVQFLLFPKVKSAPKMRWLQNIKVTTNTTTTELNAVPLDA
jgi:hypothetical protein